MAVTASRVSLSEERLAEVQALLRSQGLDGWLLYDFRGNNPIARSLLGIPPLSRRVFVFIPATGTPTAITHRIEQQPWRDWRWGNRSYLTWASLASELEGVLRGVGAVAIEYSEDDAVPYVDLIPAGVVDLLRRCGPALRPSADLVTALHSRWTPEGLASHMRASAILRECAFAAFGRVGEILRAGGTTSEAEIRDLVVSRLRTEGLSVGADAVVAVGANAANPHYSPDPQASAPIVRGDVVLLDLWGKEREASVFADQTWMAYVGDSIPEPVAGVWAGVRDARDAAVKLIADRWCTGSTIAGWEVDDAARSVLAAQGYADAFIHRTGHSIDQDLHGSGPNLDNLETRDGRILMQGVGFSVEPGVYLPGQLGIRSEINVFMSTDGPIVTTPEPQREMHLIGA